MKKQAALILFLAVLLQLVFPFAQPASAASLTNAEMRFYRLAANTATDGTNARLLIKLTPTSATVNEDEIRVTFAGNGTLGAASYGVDSTNTNITTSTTGLPTECTASPGVGANAAAVSGANVDFTVTPNDSEEDFDDGTTYCFFITGGITSPSSAGSFTNRINTLDGDVVQEFTDVYVTHTSDQVTVTAVVPSAFTFALGATSTNFTSNLSSTAVVSTTGVTGSITSNASNGWVAYLRSSNGGLDSATTGDTIDTIGSIDNAVEDLDPAQIGSESYTLAVNETTDNETNGSPDAEYNDGSPATDEGGTFNSTTLEPIASGSGPTSSYVFTMIGKATIAATTEAGSDYTDTWTVVASGNF